MKSILPSFILIFCFFFYGCKTKSTFELIPSEDSGIEFNNQIDDKQVIIKQDLLIDEQIAKVFPLLCPVIEYKWINGWKKNGWRTADRKPVKNSELWQELDEEVAKHRIEWRWVKGHSGNKYNDIADELARHGIAKIS
jgi:hypothetical protein